METETIVTPTQRKQEIESRKAHQKDVEQHTQKEKDNLIQTLSIRDRLQRRLKTKTYKTELEDDLGVFIIETRLMTSEERLNALRFNAKLRTSEGDIDEYSKALQGFKGILKDVCRTPGLEEYWDSDEVSDDVIVAVTMNAVYGSIEAVGDSVGAFRKK